MEEAEDLMEIEKASPKEWRGEMLEEGEGELLNEEDAMRAYLGLDAKEEANEPDSVILEESKDSHTSEEGDDSRVDASIDNEEQYIYIYIYNIYYVDLGCMWVQGLRA